MAGVEITWNGTSSTTIPELVFQNPTRQLLGNHRGNFLSIPGRRGSWYFPEYRDRRSIKVPGFIMADSFPVGRRDAVTALANWLDVDIEARLILGDQPDVYYEAVLGDVGDTDEWRELGTFEIEFLVQPFSFALTASSIEFTHGVTLNTAFDPDLLAPAYPVIEITPTNGTITQFSFGLNGNSISFEGLVNSGQKITINSIAAIVQQGPNTDTELTGAYDPAQLAMSGVGGVFPYLQEGTNTINWYRDAGTATTFHTEIFYRKAYRK